MSRRTASRVAATALGVAFGFFLCWGQFTSPGRIRQMLLLQDGYMWGMFAAAVAVAFVGLRVLQAAHARSPLTGAPLRVVVERPAREHVVGSVLFGAGWAISDACPGPIVAQVGLGVVWSLFTLLGAAIGVSAYLRRESARSPQQGRALIESG